MSNNEPPNSGNSGTTPKDSVSNPSTPPANEQSATSANPVSGLSEPKEDIYSLTYEVINHGASWLHIADHDRHDSYYRGNSQDQARHSTRYENLAGRVIRNSEEWTYDCSYPHMTPEPEAHVVPYVPARAEMEKVFTGVLPDPNTVRSSILQFSLVSTRPVSCNGSPLFRNECIYIQFEKLYLQVENNGSSIPAVTWKQRGFNPMNTKEGRISFAKDVFGLTDEEIEELKNK